MPSQLNETLGTLIKTCSDNLAKGCACKRVVPRNHHCPSLNRAHPSIHLATLWPAICCPTGAQRMQLFSDNQVEKDKGECSLGTAHYVHDLCTREGRRRIWTASIPSLPIHKATIIVLLVLTRALGAPLAYYYNGTTMHNHWSLQMNHQLSGVVPEIHGFSSVLF